MVLTIRIPLLKIISLLMITNIRFLIMFGGLTLLFSYPFNDLLVHPFNHYTLLFNDFIQSFHVFSFPFNDLIQPFNAFNFLFNFFTTV